MDTKVGLSLGFGLPLRKSKKVGSVNGNRRRASAHRGDKTMFRKVKARKEA